MVSWLLQELQQSAYVCGQLNIESNCFWKRRQKPCFCAVSLQAPSPDTDIFTGDFQALSAGFCHFNITLVDYNRPSNLQQYYAWYGLERVQKSFSAISLASYVRTAFSPCNFLPFELGLSAKMLPGNLHVCLLSEISYLWLKCFHDGHYPLSYIKILQ